MIYTTFNRKEGKLMTDLEYFKLSKPERILRGLGKGIISIPSRIGGGLKKLGLLIVSFFKGIGTNIACVGYLLGKYNNF